MGRMNADAFGDAVREGEISIEVALSWHLRSNHYPPVPSAMIPVAKAAIDAVQSGEPETMIELPEGVEHRTYGTEVPAHVIAESFHLYSFIEED